MSMEDIMQAMFAGGGMPGMGGMGGMQRKRKGRDVGHALPVSLEDIYNGKAVDVPRDKTILCPSCSGKGSTKPGVGGKCVSCNGMGAKIIRRQMGPMIQQMQVPCDACNGEGSKIDPKDRCKNCQGAKTKSVQSPLKVLVEKGMVHQQQIPFRGEGDQHPDIEIPGDVVVVLQQIKHDRFVRDDSDLHMTQSLTLGEALCGFQFVIHHLDGRQLVVRNDTGEMIKPGDKKCIMGEGMPVWKQPRKFGNFVIEFNVVFPERMQESQMEALRTILPPPHSLDADYDPKEAEVCFVGRMALEEVKREIEKEEDDDDEQQGGGGGVQCAHQ